MDKIIDWLIQTISKGFIVALSRKGLRIFMIKSFGGSFSPQPFGKCVILTHYIDANLYHNSLTGRFVTGIFHMVNATPIK